MPAIEINRNLTNEETEEVFGEMGFPDDYLDGAETKIIGGGSQTTTPTEEFQVSTINETGRRREANYQRLMRRSRK